MSNVPVATADTVPGVRVSETVVEKEAVTVNEADVVGDSLRESEVENVTERLALTDGLPDVVGD